MAGTTLRGIGEDESDEETPPPEKEAPSGPTVVDNAKVAESLRKLRSLEDRSGSINASGHNPLPARPTAAAADAAASARTAASDAAAAAAAGGAVGDVVDNEATVPMTPADLPGIAQGMMKPPVATPEDPAAGIKTPEPVPLSGAPGASGTLMGHPTQTLMGMSVSSLLGQPPAAGTLHGAPTNTLLGQSVGTLLGHHPVVEKAPRPTSAADAGPEPARPAKRLFGHSVPLLDQSARDQATRDAARGANARRPTPLGGAGDGVPSPEFSGGDHHFFESEPINDLFEPEFPRPKLFAKVAVGVAAASIITVAVLAYVRFSGPDDTQGEGATATTAPASQAAPAPSPAPPTPTPSPAPAATPPAPTAATATEPAAPTAAAPAPAAGSPTGVGPPASDDPALKTTPTPPAATAAATAAPAPSSPVPTAPQAEPKSEPKDDKKGVASKEPSEQPKLEKEPLAPKPAAAEKKSSVAGTSAGAKTTTPGTNDVTKAPREPAKSPVAKLATKEPAKETPASKPAREPVAVKPAATPKPATPKPVAVGSGSKPGVSGYQARTDSTKNAPSAAKPAKPVTSLSARDGAARPMKLTAPGARPTAAPKPGGRAKYEDDPDATMPLSE